MEQRPPRLGDIVDDYCPRERRVTNHAIVAIVEEAIRQTRCATCDTEHVFKGGREPRRRLGKPSLPPPAGSTVVEVTSAQLVAVVEDPVDLPEPEPDASVVEAASEPEETDASDQPTGADGWLAHRRLIRASLPKTDGEPPPPRPIPEFTMHQRAPQGRPGRGVRFDHSGRGSQGPHVRSRSFHNNGNGSSGSDDDDVNGNVAGPGAGGRGGSHAGPPGPGGQGPGGRRRRGRRHRGR